MPDLSTRNARKKLAARGAPYWQRIARGRALGYVATKGSRNPGRWQVRVAAGGTTSGYKFSSLGAADDLPHQQSDGVEVLSYADALAKATAWDPYAHEPAEADGQHDAGTVGHVVERYLAWFKEHRKSYERTKAQAEAHILDSDLAEVPVERLTVGRLQRWLADLAAKGARVRTRPGEKQRHRERDERARRATANRVWTILRAALNRAWRDGTIDCSPIWRRVETYNGVGKAKTRWLDTGEIERLMNAIDDPEFRALVSGALATGCRYGELTRMLAEDVDLDAGSVLVRESKATGSRHVFLSDEGLAFLESLVAGRDGREPLFQHKGREWRPTEQTRPMRTACEVASIEDASFHTLRHTYASLYLMAGGGLADLARQLGHTTTRMVETTYGHLADEWRAERAKRFAPSLGLEHGKVRRLRKKVAK